MTKTTEPSQGGCTAVAAVVAGRVENVLLTTLVAFLFPLVVGFQGCTATGALFKEVQIPEGKAVLYFYREWGFEGSGVAQELYVNGEYLVEVTNGGYISYVADPSQVTIVTTQIRSKFWRDNLWLVEFSLGMLCVASSHGDVTPQPCASMDFSGDRGLEQMESQGNIGPGIIEVRANEVYYFKYKFQSSWWRIEKAGFELRQVPQEIGKQEIQGLHLFSSPPGSQDNQTSGEGRDTHDQN